MLKLDRYFLGERKITIAEGRCFGGTNLKVTVSKGKKEGSDFRYSSKVRRAGQFVRQG